MAERLHAQRRVCSEDALAARRRPGEAALSVAEELLSAPVADRTNWILPRWGHEIEKRTGHRISPSRLSVVLRKKGLSAGAGRVTL
jgi:hypothetical protein